MIGLAFFVGAIVVWVVLALVLARYLMTDGDL